MNDPSLIPETLIAALQQADHVTVLTGAGISAESGVPTFREAQTGLWAKYDPQELATPGAFRRNPRLVWDWYAWRRQLVTEAQPNPGHFALVKMAERVPRFTLITQNVDSLHTRAGSVDPIELHGNVSRIKCADDGRVITQWEETDDPPPRCPDCGGYLRPDVVWFGETLPRQALTQAMEAARACQVFFSVGTSALVHPAAALPLDAVESGATTVEVNPNPTPISGYMDVTLRGAAGAILPQLLRAAWPDAEAAD